MRHPSRAPLAPLAPVFAAALALGLLTALAGAAPAGARWGRGETETERFEKTLQTDSDVRFEITNTNGSVRVRAWERSEVEIVATKGAEGEDARRRLAEIEIDVRESAGRVVVETRLPRGRFDQGSAWVEYEIQVPRGAAVDARSTNGDVDVEGVSGPVEARTTNGGIDLRDVAGAARASSTNGNVHASGLGGALVAQTTNGGVQAEIEAGELSDDVSLETTNGSVELRLDGGVKASVFARTANGSISSDFPEARAELDRRRGDDDSRRRLEIDLNGGGPRIELRSSNGSVRLRRR